MSDEEKSSRGFKVVDRRRFTSDGDARDDVEDEPEVAAPSPLDIAAAPAAAAPPPPAAAAAVPPPQAPTAQADDDEDDEDGISFVQFLQSLATQAMMQLGMMPHPATKQRELHLEGARDTLDIMALLQKKTKGNLSAEEGKLLEAMLYELRMAYVEVTKSIAAQSMGGMGPGGMGPGGMGPGGMGPGGMGPGL